MSKPVQDILATLQQLLAEHRKLLAQTEIHQQAMRTLDLTGMDESARLQDAIRARITSLDARRRLQTAVLAKSHKWTGELTLLQIAELYPAERNNLLVIRDDLRRVAQATQDRTHVAGRLAGALLGHLNVAVRALAGAVEQAGVYTKQGIPRVSSRIGAIEAVG